MSAVRLARAATGARAIVKFDGCYHGHADAPARRRRLRASPRSAFRTRRVSPLPPSPTRSWRRSTISRPWRRSSRRAATSIAAILVEPVAGNMGVVPPEPGYLEGLRAIADRAGALLVFDEVMTGWRVHPAARRALYGVRPDLTMPGQGDRRRPAGGGLRRPRGADGADGAGRSGVSGGHALRQSARDGGRPRHARRARPPRRVGRGRAVGGARGGDVEHCRRGGGRRGAGAAGGHDADARSSPTPRCGATPRPKRRTARRTPRSSTRCWMRASTSRRPRSRRRSPPPRTVRPSSPRSTRGCPGVRMVAVAVIGGGIAGLTAAYRLTPRGDSVSSTRRAAGWGASILTERATAILAERGPQLAGEPTTRDEVAPRGTRAGERQHRGGSAPARKRYVVRAGRLVPLPMSPPRSCSHPGFCSSAAKLAVFGEPWWPSATAHGGEHRRTSCARRFGGEVLDYAADPFVGGDLRGRPGALSVRNAMPQLYALERSHGSMLQGARGGRRARGQTEDQAGEEPPAPLVSFRRGDGEIPEALARGLRATGSDSGAGDPDPAGGQGMDRRRGVRRGELYDGVVLTVSGARTDGSDRGYPGG